MSTESLPKVCVILGAGASWDVHSGSSPLIDANFQPPLARDLFDIQHHPAYWEVLQQYPGARALTDILVGKIAGPDFDLESELRSLAEHSDPQICEHFKQIPQYLRDLLYRASTRYTHQPGSYVELIYYLLSQVPHEALFLILNYDNLLENALTSLKDLGFQNISDYIALSRQAKVVKLHGSINWFKHIGRAKDPWLTSLNTSEVFQKVTEHEIMVRDGIESVRAMKIDDNYIYPILTAPLAGKGTKDMVCPDSHVEYAQKFLAQCHKFLIIGTSGLDADLMDLLDTSIPPKSGPVVDLVGVRDANEVFDRFTGSVRAFRSISTLSNTHRIGFRAYISGEPIQKFAAIGR